MGALRRDTLVLLILSQGYTVSIVSEIEALDELRA